MKRIRLQGKHAVGQHQWATVDDDVFVELNTYKWKAKPNGSGTHVYAVRESKGRTVRMHRVVLGYDGPLDIDHINRDPLDNRRVNLRVATRSVNQLNRREAVASFTCSACGQPAIRLTTVGQEDKTVFCSTACKVRANTEKQAAKRAAEAAPYSPLRICKCQQCGQAFSSVRADKLYCTEACKAKSKRARWASNGTLADHYAKAAVAAKHWRERRKSGQPGLPT